MLTEDVSYGIYNSVMERWIKPVSFEWDAGNRDKSFRKHGVNNAECEEVFFDPHKRLLGPRLHGVGVHREDRYLLIGRTKALRALFVVFTLRHGKIRVVSARDLNRKERGLLP